ncbi:RloB family protein [Lentzea tibetensis]|nr:RloB family protein [Lentzea tibetensis]
MARRENSQSRREGRDQKIRPGHVLIVCGAEATEIDYLSGFKEKHRARIKLKGKVDSPENLVMYAKRIFSPDEFDAVWCVVDVDHFDIGAAERAAQRAGVELAVSNPCFEVWLLLHFTEHRAYVTDGKAACALVARHVPGYDKTKLDYAQFHAGVEKAVQRAKALEPGNPSTGVWRLVEAVLRR